MLKVNLQPCGTEDYSVFPHAGSVALKKTTSKGPEESEEFGCIHVDGASYVSLQGFLDKDHNLDITEGTWLSILYNPGSCSQSGFLEALPVHGQPALEMSKVLMGDYRTHPWFLSWIVAFLSSAAFQCL